VQDFFRLHGFDYFDPNKTLLPNTAGEQFQSLQAGIVIAV
jgi:hypothetical protein